MNAMGYALAMANGSQQPLPKPWTQHVAPSGFFYYYNPITTDSTYNRPISLSFASLGKGSSPKRPKKKREKPAKKTEIPSSPWIRVLTNKGNVFYSNVETKQSTWEIPGEIESAIAALEAMELMDDAVDQLATGSEASPRGAKRKLEEDVGADERGGKRARKEGATSEEDDASRAETAQGDTGQEENEEGKPDESVPKIPVEEAIEMLKALLRDKDINPMHPWETSLPKLAEDERYNILQPSLSASQQRDVFEGHCKELLNERKRAKEEGDSSSSKPSAPPIEGYRSLLKEIVTSTRTTYTQFRQQVKKDRRFYSFGRDEKERDKEFRTYLKELGEVKKNERKRAEEAFLSMLKEAKASEHPKKWSDAKKAFQKDPRYDAVGSSSLREELYDTFLKAVQGQIPVQSAGAESAANPVVAIDPEEEKKRRRERAVKEREEKVRIEKERMERENARSRAGLTLEEAELTFKTLLVDVIRDPTVSFPSAISYISADPRFASVTQASSAMNRSRLERLFQEHVSHLQSKGGGQLHALFESYAPGLDVRWESLTADTKASIASSGVSKRLGLDGKVSLRPSRSNQRRRGGIGHDARSDSEEEDEEKDDFEYPALRNEFERWQRQRFTDARNAFDAMLAENAFIEFWGRVKKMGLTDADEKQRLGKVVFADENAGGTSSAADMDVDDEAEEGEGGGGKRDLQALAKEIDVHEVERVLQRDKRWIVFNYIPQERERWLSDHLQNLSAPRASVHVG